MNWEAIGAIGEILGAVAVVATLVFLSRQIKGASKQFALASTAEANTLYSDGFAPIYASKDNLRIWTQGHRDPTALDEDDLEIFFLFMARVIAVYDTVVEHHVEGAISDDKMNRYRDFSKQFLVSPGGKLWIGRKHYQMSPAGLKLMDL